MRSDSVRKVFSFYLSRTVTSNMDERVNEWRNHAHVYHGLINFSSRNTKQAVRQHVAETTFNYASASKRCNSVNKIWRKKKPQPCSFTHHHISRQTLLPQLILFFSFNTKPPHDRATDTDTTCRNFLSLKSSCPCLSEK